MYNSYISLTTLHVVQYFMPQVVCPVYNLPVIYVQIKLCDSACSGTDITSNWVGASTSSHLRMWRVRALLPVARGTTLSTL